MIKTAFHGFCMALADSVPGVSGSTIAFIMGYYETFLLSLHGLFGMNSDLRKKSVTYLAKFAVGWAIGIITSILIISRIFEVKAYFLSSIFLGLTVVAIPVIINEEIESFRGKYRYLVFTMIGLLLVVGLGVIKGSIGSLASINFLALGPVQYIYLAFSGLLAISAMLLPGVSGSTLLLIFGVYVSTVNAVKHVLHFDFRYLPGILALAFGIIVGAATIARYIRAALKKFRPQMMYFILGLLLGSVHAIIMGPSTLDVPQAPLSFANFSIIGFAIGIGILGGLELMKRKTQKDAGVL